MEIWIFKLWELRQNSSVGLNWSCCRCRVNLFWWDYFLPGLSWLGLPGHLCLLPWEKMYLDFCICLKCKWYLKKLMFLSLCSYIPLYEGVIGYECPGCTFLLSEHLLWAAFPLAISTSTCVRIDNSVVLHLVFFLGWIPIHVTCNSVQKSDFCLTFDLGSEITVNPS